MNLPLHRLLAIVIWSFIHTSCGVDSESDSESNINSDGNQSNTNEFDSLIESQHSTELSAFLNADSNFSSDISLTDKTPSGNKQVYAPGVKDTAVIEPTVGSPMEETLRELEDSSLSHQQGLEKIRKLTSEKDQRISLLELENASLLRQIEDLQKQLRNISDKSDTVSSTPNLVAESELGSAIQDLKQNFDRNSKEVTYLKAQNELITNKFSNLGKEEDEITIPPSATDIEDNDTLSILKDIPPQEIGFSLKSNCTLSFDAVVTTLNGKSKEAFYTEFFIIKQDLNNLLLENGILLSNFPQVSSYGELWARSRKNPFLYPNVLKNIRDLLMDQVAKGNGVRIRTDINGSATIQNLDKSLYYVVGSASLGKVGVTWSVPVELVSGTNKLSLTLGNSIWSY